MRSQLKTSIKIGIFCAVALCAGTLAGREEYMKRLPVYRTYQCTICHESSRPLTGDDLNNFGVDFNNNARAWNSTLAAKDSDKDGFRNGVELGDENGDGIAEVGIERSNPGDPLNTPNSVDRSTWGILKSLFED